MGVSFFLCLVELGVRFGDVRWLGVMFGGAGRKVWRCSVELEVRFGDVR